MKSTAQFRPKLDAAHLRNVNQIAWQAKSDIIEAELQLAGEILANQLESLYPAEDMKLLTRYNCTREQTEVYVRIYVAEEHLWNESASIKLSRPVHVPTSFSNMAACSPKWSREPNRGVNAETREAMQASGEWDQFCADQDRRARLDVPEELDKTFRLLVDVRKKYKAEYKAITEWPKEYKSEHGKYPTWQQIADAFPVAGELLLED